MGTEPGGATISRPGQELPDVAPPVRGRLGTRTARRAHPAVTASCRAEYGAAGTREVPATA